MHCKVLQDMMTIKWSTRTFHNWFISTVHPENVILGWAVDSSKILSISRCTWQTHILRSWGLSYYNRTNLGILTAETSRNTLIMTIKLWMKQFRNKYSSMQTNTTNLLLTILVYRWMVNPNNKHKHLNTRYVITTGGHYFFA